MTAIKYNAVIHKAQVMKGLGFHPPVLEPWQTIESGSDCRKMGIWALSTEPSDRCL